MLHDQTINFLLATVVFLLLTNAISIMLAAWAMRLVITWRPATTQATSAVTRRIESVLGRLT
jgi:hypothetical protein